MARERRSHAQKKGTPPAAASPAVTSSPAAPPKPDTQAIDPKLKAAFHDFLKALAREAARMDDAQER